MAISAQGLMPASFIVSKEEFPADSWKSGAINIIPGQRASLSYKENRIEIRMPRKRAAN